LRGLHECIILHDRREVQRDEKVHSLLLQAMQHNAMWNPDAVDPYKRQQASYNNKYQDNLYQALERAKDIRKAEKAAWFGVNYGTSTNTAPKGQNTSSIWYDEKLSNQLTITTTTNTANSTHIHINPHTSITQRMLGAVKAEPKPDPLSCMWCAAVFQTEEELDLHENGCGK